MNQVLNGADVVKQGSQSLQHSSMASGTGTRTEQIEQVRRDIEQRATVMGPVLEEILRSHWEHWGLND
jgi:hypothetical protein